MYAPGMDKAEDSLQGVRDDLLKVSGSLEKAWAALRVQQARQVQYSEVVRQEWSVLSTFEYEHGVIKYEEEGFTKKIEKLLVDQQDIRKKYNAYFEQLKTYKTVSYALKALIDQLDAKVKSLQPSKG